MPPMPSPLLRVTIGTESFDERFAMECAPNSCRKLHGLLPYSGRLVHARWSGECLFAPLETQWPRTTLLAEENATDHPLPGEILLYAGETSEPELLITYAGARFACISGELSGNRVLVIDGDLKRLAKVGRKVLWEGATLLPIE
jgi:hypothetical protein